MIFPPPGLRLIRFNHFKAWGQVVAIKFKSQQKYVTVTVSIELNQVATGLWNEGVWTAPLGGCKAFKIIQDRGTRKLITYYESWADLEKVLGKAFSLDEFTGDWMRYFTPNLKQRRRNPQKVNQEGGSK
ncbi:hypothetical protein RhiirA4_424900, partial [Rhizophagus irregularis]